MHSYRRKDGLAGPTLLYVREWSWALWFVVTVRRVRSGWPPSMGSLREACFVQDRPGPGRWGFTRRSGLGLWVCASTAFRPSCGGAWGGVRRSWGNVEGLGLARPSAGFGHMAPRPAPLFSTRGRAPGAGFTGNGAFQCFRVTWGARCSIGPEMASSWAGTMGSGPGSGGLLGTPCFHSLRAPGEKSGGAAVPLGIARGGPRPFSWWAPRAAAYAALRRDPAAPVDGFTSSWVARRHAPGPGLARLDRRPRLVGIPVVCGQGPASAPGPPGPSCAACWAAPPYPSSASPFRDGCRDGG